MSDLVTEYINPTVKFPSSYGLVSGREFIDKLQNSLWTKKGVFTIKTLDKDRHIALKTFNRLQKGNKENDKGTQES